MIIIISIVANTIDSGGSLFLTFSVNIIHLHFVLTDDL